MATTKTKYSGRFANTLRAIAAGDSAQWQRTDAIFAEWQPPKGRDRLRKEDYDCAAAKGGKHSGDDCCLYRAQLVAGFPPVAYNTARQWWKMAEVWPANERFDGITYSAHFAAKDNGGTTKGAVNALKATLASPEVNGDAAKVTVNRVRGVVRSLRGRHSKAQGKAQGLSLSQLAKALGSIKVNDHLAPLGDDGLADWVKALTKALDQANRHQATRARRTSGTTGKATKPASKAKAKAEATKAKGAKPASTRG